MTIHKNTTVIRFKSGMKTNATKPGDPCAAYRRAGQTWLLVNEKDSSEWSCSVGTLRIMLDMATGVVQARSLDELVSYGDDSIL